MSLLSPALAFILYWALLVLLMRLGRTLAAHGHDVHLKRSTYASGEAPPTQAAAPGYRPFFVLALFFAMLHLSVLVVMSGMPTALALLYVLGLAVTLGLLALG
jgi:NADH:ubiquinone oxidoreductase subunit 3 (subunit A)